MNRDAENPKSFPAVLSAAAMAPDRTLDPSTLGDHIDRLFRAAWALSGSRAEAEDLVQETFARVLAKPRRVRNEDDLGYLLQALRNTFISSRRAAARRLAPETLADRAEPIDPSTARRPEQAVEAREVFAVIAGLPEQFRDALVAVDVAGLSYAEAAELLGTKEATITSRLFRARAQVARGMEPAPQGVQGSRGETDD
jgi:RNA polymerase sigma-70 factor, ECF subfamily